MIFASNDIVAYRLVHRFQLSVARRTRCRLQKVPASDQLPLIEHLTGTQLSICCWHSKNGFATEQSFSPGHQEWKRHSARLMFLSGCRLPCRTALRRLPLHCRGCHKANTHPSRFHHFQTRPCGCTETGHAEGNFQAMTGPLTVTFSQWCHHCHQESSDKPCN